MFDSKFTNLKGKKILLGVCGSIASVKSPNLVSQLIKQGAEVKCILTDSAKKFISPLSLSILSRNISFIDKDQWNYQQFKPLHIFLAEWADLLVIYPITATTISKWSTGNSEGLLSSVIIAFDKPIISAPAMNCTMWSNVYVKSNWEKIKSLNNVVAIEPSEGLLACDSEGQGRVVEPELILFLISDTLLKIDLFQNQKKDLSGLNILISAGATQEDIDLSRVITNKSSGKMGWLLAQSARLRGASVTLVMGKTSVPELLFEGIKTCKIVSSNELRHELLHHQNEADWIIMAAAVSDMQPKENYSGNKKKLPKKELLRNLSKSLEITPDILKELVLNKKESQLILGFAAVATDAFDLNTQGKEKLLSKRCDLMMINPIDIVNQGFESDFNSGLLIGQKNIKKSFDRISKHEMAHNLLEELQKMTENIS